MAAAARMLVFSGRWFLIFSHKGWSLETGSAAPLCRCHRLFVVYLMREMGQASATVRTCLFLKSVFIQWPKAKTVLETWIQVGLCKRHRTSPSWGLMWIYLLQFDRVDFCIGSEGVNTLVHIATGCVNGISGCMHKVGNMVNLVPWPMLAIAACTQLCRGQGWTLAWELLQCPLGS